MWRSVVSSWEDYLLLRRTTYLLCCLRLSWEDLLHGIQTLAAQLYQQIPWSF